MNKQKCAGWISILSFFVINLKPTVFETIFDGLITLAILFVVSKYELFDRFDRKMITEHKATALLSGIITVMSGSGFYYSWTLSSKLLKLCFNNHVLKSIVLTVGTVFLMTGCFLIFNLLLSKMVTVLSDDEHPTIQQSAKLNLLESGILLITAFLCVTICSESSPIYPFNNWDDANLFFTVGKSIVHNKVIYKDLCEQKGPLLHFIYLLAYSVSHTTFIGVYFLELISCFVFLTISYKTLRLFTDTKAIYTVPVCAFIIFSSYALSHGGSAEEFCLPFVASSNFIAMKALQSNEKLSWKNCLLFGVSSGVVFWIKYSMLGFYFGAGLVFVIWYLKMGWIKRLFQSFVVLMSGVSFVSLPLLFYFFKNDALSDLFQTYFYDNIFIYSTSSSSNRLLGLIKNLYTGAGSFIENYSIGFVMITLGMLFLSRKKKSIYLYALITFASSFFFIYSGGRHFIYYSFLLSVYVPFGALLFLSVYQTITEKNVLKCKYIQKSAISFSVVTYSLCIILSFVFGYNTYMLKFNKEDLPQYQFDKYISQTKNPTLLNYGFIDGGFYTVSDIIPNCKYYCILTIPLDIAKQTQDDYIENERIDYVVTRDKTLSDSQQVHYQLICSSTFEESRENFCTYYLYKKR